MAASSASGRSAPVGDVVYSVWDDVTSLRELAGEDIDAMVLYQEAEHFVLETPSLVHYDVHSATT